MADVPTPTSTPTKECAGCLEQRPVTMFGNKTGKRGRPPKRCIICQSHKKFAEERKAGEIKQCVGCWKEFKVTEFRNLRCRRCHIEFAAKKREKTGWAGRHELGVGDKELARLVVAYSNAREDMLMYKMRQQWKSYYPAKDKARQAMEEILRTYGKEDTKSCLPITSP